MRENHVVEFEEGRRVAWTRLIPAAHRPDTCGGGSWTRSTGHERSVTHTYDWSRLTDEKRLPRARATTAEKLRASLDRLAALVEGSRRA